MIKTTELESLEALVRSWDARADHYTGLSGDFWAGMAVKSRDCAGELRILVAQLARVHDSKEEATAQLTPGRRRPTDTEFARAWHETGSRTADGTPRRRALAKRYGVAESTIDLWMGKIRKRSPGLIPPPATGRGVSKKTKH